jgi:hypothetical protein
LTNVEINSAKLFVRCCVEKTTYIPVRLALYRQIRGASIVNKPAVVPAEPYLNYHNVPRHPKEALSASSSRNGGQGKPLRNPLPLPRTLAASGPAKVVSLLIDGRSVGKGPPTLGGPAAVGEATEATATGRLQGSAAPLKTAFSESLQCVRRMRSLHVTFRNPNFITAMKPR